MAAAAANGCCGPGAGAAAGRQQGCGDGLQDILIQGQRAGPCMRAFAHKLGEAQAGGVEHPEAGWGGGEGREEGARGRLSHGGGRGPGPDRHMPRWMALCAPNARTNPPSRSSCVQAVQRGVPISINWGSVGGVRTCSCSPALPLALPRPSLGLNPSLASPPLLPGGPGPGPAPDPNPLGRPLKLKPPKASGACTEPSFWRCRGCSPEVEREGGSRLEGVWTPPAPAPAPAPAASWHVPALRVVVVVVVPALPSSSLLLLCLRLLWPP